MGWDLADVTPYKLTLTGTGAMKDYLTEDDENGDSRTTAPWKNFADQFQTISIRNGITSIGEYAFYRCRSALSVEISDSGTTIGEKSSSRSSSS